MTSDVTEGERIRQAIRFVQERYPIKEYFEETIGAVEAVAKLVNGLSPEGSRLLVSDVGA